MRTRHHVGKRVCFHRCDSSSWGNWGHMWALTKLVELLLRLLAELLLAITTIAHHARLLHAHATIGSIWVAWIWLDLAKLIIAPITPHLLGLLGHIRVWSASRGVTKRIV